MADVIVRERPILFSDAMVRAILDGRKTQTRRALIWRGAPAYRTDGAWRCLHDGLWCFCREDDGYPLGGTGVCCPFGRVGDRLWVREAWLELDREGWIDEDRPKEWLTTRHGPPRRNGIAYRADTDAEGDQIRKDLGYRWRPSIHMPRWASRITLEITEVRVERLGEMPTGDVRAEGIGAEGDRNRVLFDRFKKEWDAIYAKKPGLQWAANPYVWVVGFRRVEATS